MSDWASKGTAKVIEDQAAQIRDLERQVEALNNGLTRVAESRDKWVAKVGVAKCQVKSLTEERDFFDAERQKVVVELETSQCQLSEARDALETIARCTEDLPSIHSIAKRGLKHITSKGSNDGT